jgi:hypothetical protein
MNTVYKILYNPTGTETYFSYLKVKGYSSDKISIEYKFDDYVYPKIGKLFAFSTIMAAINWTTIDTLYNYNCYLDGILVIAEMESKNKLIKPRIKNIPVCWDVLTDINNAKEFWSGNLNTAVSELPKHTILCDSLKIKRILSKEECVYLTS